MVTVIKIWLKRLYYTQNPAHPSDTHSTDPLQTWIYILLQTLICNQKNNSPYRKPWNMFFLNFLALSVKNQLSIPAHINLQMLHLQRTPSNVNLWTWPQSGNNGWRFHYISVWINQITSLSALNSHIQVLITILNTMFQHTCHHPHPQHHSLPQCQAPGNTAMDWATCHLLWPGDETK